jgi:hypothetical protein
LRNTTPKQRGLDSELKRDPFFIMLAATPGSHKLATRVLRHSSRIDHGGGPKKFVIGDEKT